MRQLIVCTLALLGAAAQAAELPIYRLTLQDNLFFPSVLAVPSGVKFKLLIANKDASPEEFDSFDLNREKVIFGESEAVIYVGPLPEGRYEYFGEYHPATARGLIKASGILPTDAQVGNNEQELPRAD